MNRANNKILPRNLRKLYKIKTYNLKIKSQNRSKRFLFD